MMTSRTNDRAMRILFCAAVLLIWYALRMALTLPVFRPLLSSHLLVPLFCLAQCLLLLPFYAIYQRRYQDIPCGSLHCRTLSASTLLLLLLLLAQSLYRQPESWGVEQLAGDRLSVLLFFAASMVLAPLAEEVLFRGFLFQGLSLMLANQRWLSALLTSLIFAALHSQYSHWQSLLSLTLLSLLLCYARLRSGGLMLPLVLHMLNNFLSLCSLWWLAE